MFLAITHEYVHTKFGEAQIMCKLFQSANELYLSSKKKCLTSNSHGKIHFSIIYCMTYITEINSRIVKNNYFFTSDVRIRNLEKEKKKKEKMKKI